MDPGSIPGLTFIEAQNGVDAAGSFSTSLTIHDATLNMLKAHELYFWEP